MTNQPTLGAVSRITLYPIKSLDGVEVTAATITSGGALQHDREFVLLNEDGRLMRAKETPTLHRIRAAFDLGNRSVRLSHAADAGGQSFHLDGDRSGIAEWLSAVLQQKVHLLCNTDTGIPDDPNLYGPTLVATSTLRAVTSWFPGLHENEMRRRLRANIEFDADRPFAEDALVGDPGEVVSLSIGDVRLDGVSLCARCEVPARDSRTGETDGQFARQFVERRRATMPPWASPARFDHHYRLCVRTDVSPDQAGRRIAVGDPCRRLGVHAVDGEPRRFNRLRDRVAHLVSEGA